MGPSFSRTPVYVKSPASESIRQSSADSYIHQGIEVPFIYTKPIMSDEDWGWGVSSSVPAPSYANGLSERPRPPPGAIDLWVPQGRVGGIIGRGGSKLKEIQDQSGARVKVSELYW